MRDQVSCTPLRISISPGFKVKGTSENAPFAVIEDEKWISCGAGGLIPASRKKRGVVLRWRMRSFAAGRRHSEAEVNAAIQERHWDSATLRREPVGHCMLARKDRVYWRLPEAEWKPGGEA